MVRLSVAAVLFFGVSALAGGAGKGQGGKGQGGVAAKQQQQAKAKANAQQGQAGQQGQAKKKFITAECNNKAECASGCCAARNGKKTCAALGAIGVKSTDDPKCDA